MPCIIDREEARKKYTPRSVNLLFVAEAPPPEQERYFYFPDVPNHDHLWVELMKALYPDEFGETGRERERKRDWLRRFQRGCYMLVDACKEPVPKIPKITKKDLHALLLGQRDDLVAEIEKICPRQILLIKASVYDALYKPLKKAGLPVVEGRLPFPAFRWQSEFQNCFENLVRSGKLTLSNTRG